MRLTEVQTKALNKLNKQRDWECAYTLRVRLTTLRALHRLGLVEADHRLGAMFFPTNHIYWRITEKGKGAIDG